MDDFFTPLEMMLRLLAAAGLGAILGWEREAQQKAAGLRTHMMVSLGAASFTIATLHLADVTAPEAQADPLRIVEGVIAAVGFLAAGQIIQARGAVAGLTTAAGIWVVGGVGMACGAGFYVLAVLTVVLAVVILAALGRAEERFLSTPARGRRAAGRAPSER